MKVFLDTNVLVSAFTTRGLCADLFRSILAEHELVCGKPILDELERVLVERFHVPQPTVDDILALLQDHPVTAVPATLPDVDIRDADDLRVLASALGSKADILVTGDQDLLVVEQVGGLRIVSPRGFWELSRQS